MNPHPLDEIISITSVVPDSGRYRRQFSALKDRKDRDYVSLFHLSNKCTNILEDPTDYWMIQALGDIAVYAHDWAHSLGIQAPWQAMRDEYDRAKAKHGDNTFDNVSMDEYLKYFALIEEVGEIARALTYDKEHAGELADEIVQVGGLALAWATARIEMMREGD